jgi:hypothetical protein
MLFPPLKNRVISMRDKDALREKELSEIDAVREQELNQVDDLFDFLGDHVHCGVHLPDSDGWHSWPLCPQNAK